MFQEVRKIAILNTVSWKSANRKGDIKGGENGSQRCPGGRALQVNPEGGYMRRLGGSAGSVQRGHHILSGWRNHCKVSGSSAKREADAQGAS